MRSRIQLAALALGSAMVLAGCASTAANVERVAEGKYDIKVFGKGAELYQNWDKEAKQVCNGAFQTENRLAGKSADGQEFLTGRISCLPTKK